MEPPSPTTGGPARRRGLTKSQKIGIGLLLTILGLFFLSALLPTAPEQLAYTLTVAALGIISLWVGGILMGIGSRS